MSNPTIQFKRGTEAQVDAITPAAGEPVWVTDAKNLHVGDGSTSGGIVLNVSKAMAYAKFDLSGAAQVDVPVIHAIERAISVENVVLLYTEASSANPGVTVTVGKQTDNDYFYTGTSEVSKAQWYELDVTLLQTVLDASDTLVCGHAGSKTGTGEILVFVKFHLDV